MCQMCGSTRNSKTVLTVCPWQLQFANSVTTLNIEMPGTNIEMDLLYLLIVMI